MASVLTQVFVRLSLRERWSIVVESLSPKIILLTAALMIFKATLRPRGPSTPWSASFPRTGYRGISCCSPPRSPSAFLTGVNQAFVAIAFPLLVPIIGQGNPDMWLLAFAYVSGFVGILLSPAHLCLALTADYFKAPLRDVYKILIWPTAVVFLSALIMLVVSRLIM